MTAPHHARIRRLHAHPARAPRACERGLSILEIAIALTLLSFVLLTLCASVYEGRKVRVLTHEKVTAVQRLRDLAEQVRRQHPQDLLSAFGGSGGTSGFGNGGSYVTAGSLLQRTNNLGPDSAMGGSDFWTEIETPARDPMTGELLLDDPDFQWVTPLFHDALQYAGPEGRDDATLLLEQIAPVRVKLHWKGLHGNQTLTLDTLVGQTR